MIRVVHAPTCFEQLWEFLDAGVTVMAGGTDLLVRRTAAVPEAVVLLEGIPALREIREDDGLLRLGAGATHAALARHPLVRDRLPILATALSALGSPAIRNMGTLGGNIATASPAGDTLPPLLALNARVELASRGGIRSLPLAEFLLGPGRTALAPGEIITAVCLAPPAAGVLQHFEKVGRRNALAIAVVSLAALIDRDADGGVTAARLACGSVAPTVCCAPKAAAALIGHPLDRETLGRAGKILRQEIAPIDDVRASAAYRRQVADNLLLRLAIDAA